MYIEKGYIPFLDGQSVQIAIDNSGLSSYSDFKISIASGSFRFEKLDSTKNCNFYFRLLVRELQGKSNFSFWKFDRKA